MTDDEHLRRAAAARLLLESPAYKSARDELVADHMAAIRDSDFDDTAGRERHFRIARAFELLHAELEARAIIGQRISERLEEQQTTQDEEF